jgi:hypothetical protein
MECTWERMTNSLTCNDVIKIQTPSPSIKGGNNVAGRKIKRKQTRPES